MRFSIRRLLAVVASALVGLPGVAAAQQGSPATITGRVTAEGGTPVAGASVFIEGQQIGAQTTDEGRYTVLVPAARATGQPATLTVRSIGYKPVSQPVTLTPGATVTRDFTLAVNPLRLGEVVVTGAGTTSTRERVGSVINSVDSSLIRRAAEPQNVVTALAGKAPNVEVRSQAGDPGAGASIKIRGATSIGIGTAPGTAATNQPLFVIDGQPVDNSTTSTAQGPADFAGTASTVAPNRAADINPNDIESVEILKGAGAAAIYGARAANGVVLITTKRGRAGQTRVSFQSTETFDDVIKTMPLQRIYGLGVIVDGTATTPACNAFAGPLDCRPSVAGFGGVNTSWGPALAAGTKTFDHADDIYDTGLTADNNLSVSGGNERTTFFLSGGLTRQNGTISGPNNEYNRTSVRLKATHEVARNFMVGGNFSYIDARGKFVQKGSNVSGLLLGSLRTPPEFNNENFIDTTGLHRSYRFPHPSSGSLTETRGYDNPFFVLNNTGNTSNLGRFIGNVNFDWTPIQWLTFRYTLGSDYYADRRIESLPFTSSSNPVGQVTRLDLSNLEIDHNLLAIGRHQFNESINGSLTLGQNLNSRRFWQTWEQGQNLNAPDPFALQNTLNPQIPQEVKQLRHAAAYFAQAELDMYQQLFVNLGLRYDGFSTFGSSDRWAAYPKAQVSWIFSNFLGNTEQRGAFSYGKLRASYGETGREPPVYSTVSGVFSLASVFGSGYGDFINASQSFQGGVATPLQAPNPDLKPERNKEFEVGFDLGFLDQKVDMGATYYSKNSTDVILAVPVSSAAVGSQSVFKNGARVTNKGVEVTLNARPFTSENFAWDFGLNYGRNRGKVVDLSGAEFVTYNSEGFTGAIGSSTVGFAPGVLRGSDFARCGITADDFVVDDVTGATLGASCGGAKQGALFLDASGLPVVDPTDRVIADPNPDWTGGFNTTVRMFKNLRVGMLFDVRQGGQVWNGTRGALYRFGTHKDTDIRSKQGKFLDIPGMKDRYNQGEVGPGVGVTAFTNPQAWQDWFLGQGGGFGDNSAQFIESGNFVKWRELSVTYSFTQPWVKNAGLSTVDLRLAGRNLKTWTKYRGLDPETNLGGAEWLTQGVDFFSNPLTRSFVVSLTLNR